MEDKILGLHHITAIAAHAQRNYDFYTKVLGLRLVKKTVNFDDPGTYHSYFGNEMGAPEIDRNYFYSVYFRERGGILFELASDNPGFAIDEPVSELGNHLMLPSQYEESRKKIEEVLPKLSF